MAVIVYGTSYFGLVDRVPGEYHVATLFRHVQYVPLIPVGSFIVLEDENGKDTEEVRSIPLHGRSVALGYLRGGFGAVALFSALLGFAMATGYFFGRESPILFFAAIALAVGLVWASIGPRSLLFLPGQMTFHGLSLVLILAGFLLPPALEPGGRPNRETGYWIPLVIANLVLFGYMLTRIGQNAGRRRARELEDLLEEDDEEATFEVVSPRKRR